jgi:hypothetical protein
VQNTCKLAYYVSITFLEFSGYLLGLLHGCCTRAAAITLSPYGADKEQVLAVHFFEMRKVVSIG